MRLLFKFLARLLLATAVIPVPAIQAQEARPLAEAKRPVPLYDGLGDHSLPVSTTSPMAQRYFDQGLAFAYGFNHEAAILSFKAATEIDPRCAMCYWGIALAYGPNINKAMADADGGKAWAALTRARELATSSQEKAYITALASRYSPEGRGDRRALDEAYAVAMRALVQRYPDDVDALTLFAESLMDTMPWDYYLPSGEPKPKIREAIQALERAMSLKESHLGANHFYIHAVEASRTPERGLPAARRIGRLAPSLGHLVHMAAHIYLRVGLYHEASTANEEAVLADERYLDRSRAHGFYPATYYSHNYHFLWFTAALEGRRRDSIAAARKVLETVARHGQHGGQMMQWMQPALLFAFVRFGEWDAILTEPAPADLFHKSMWHYARGLAFAHKGDGAGLDREAKAVATVLANQSDQLPGMPHFPAERLVRIADSLLQAEQAHLAKQPQARLAHLEAGVAIQDGLPYMEPPYWHHSLRLSLGKALLDQGQLARAERVFRDDLDRHPKNGWALKGLQLSLEGQGKSGEAREVERGFSEAWRYADISLTGPELD